MGVQQPTVGQYIRSNVIPAGMSVKEAAARLGVGRPALSNLLNGKSALSRHMAKRLAEAFGADNEALLELQSRQDGEQHNANDVAVRRYVPRPLTVHARDLEGWADTVQAREGLPVLLRKLVHGTGQDLQRVDFPGGDNSQRRGWDGWVEAGAATAWIPAGESGWEFGTSKDPRRKAESDYEKRLALSPNERERCVFVFVTPRNWPGKAEWAKEKEASGHGWKAVRAYDASDLEQWLDESVVAPVWLGEKLSARVIAGTKTLDQCWEDWADATEPNMTKHIFQSSINGCKGLFTKWLETPPKRPFFVAADSQAEALAFLACLFDELPGQSDLAAVFERPDALTTLAASSAPFIPIAGSTEAQQPFVSLRERMRCIATCPRNAIGVQPDYALPLLDDRAFAEGAAGMGFDRHDVERLARESGRSPTILRRRLAVLPTLETPPWASDYELARILIPLCLVGAWDAHTRADREVLATLADCEPKEIEEGVARLQQGEDSPIWAIGEHRGVTSKVDVLFQVAGLMTEQDIADLLMLAEYVLSESNPALELPEEDRWAAAIHGKLRDHSEALRDGLCETLVLLSVHGNGLFQERLGINVEALVSNLIERLLTPLDEKLPSQENDLPCYAEAAPDRFLALMEADVQRNAPAVLRLLRPVSSLPFAPCPRSGILWALECLAWNPDHLCRVALLLAELSRVPIGDGVVNRPINSLASLIRSWKPQTAAPVGERMHVLEMIAERYPEIGWQLCLGEIKTGARFAGDNYRPKWRSDAAFAGDVVSDAEFRAMTQCAGGIVLSWDDHDQTTLGDLVENIDAFPDDRRSGIWERIDTWARDQTDDVKAELQQRILRLAFTRGRDEDFRTTIERAHATYDRLRPRDPVVRHLWLFAEDWPRDVWENTKSDVTDSLDFEAQRAKIESWRSDAMDEIWHVDGLDGALKLVERGGQSVGRYVARHATDVADVLRECLSRQENLASFDAFMREFIAECADPAKSAALVDISVGLPGEQIVRLWQCAPSGERTWRALDRLPAETRRQYWKTVSPVGWQLSESECTEMIEMLSEVGRPLAAFRAVGPFWKKVESGCLKRLLTAVLANEGKDPTRLESHQVSAAFSSLAGRGVVAEEEMANLEFAFIAALEHSEHGIPNLERQLSKHPALFVRMLAYRYKRDDDGIDPPEWDIEREAQARAVGHAAYHLLRLAKRIPGTNDDGAIEGETLWRWLVEARDLCAKHGRSAVGDNHIGELLSKVPAGEDGGWPSPVVCDALERMRSEDVAKGLCRGKLNARGIVVGSGGDKDRELAAEFRRHAQQRRADFPFASRVIDRIARHYEQSAKHEDTDATLAKRLNTWG